MVCSTPPNNDERPRPETLRKLLDELLHQSDFAWWEWDIGANRVSFNDRKVTMLGYDPADFIDVGYQVFTSLLHPDDYERTMDAMRAHLEGEASIYQIDYRIRRADGSYQWYLDRGCTLAWADDGRPSLLRGLVVDLGDEFHRRAHSDALLASFRSALPGPRDHRASVTLCSVCQRLKISNEEWVEVREELPRAFPRSASHGICLDCVKVLYPEEAEELVELLSTD